MLPFSLCIRNWKIQLYFLSKDFTRTGAKLKKCISKAINLVVILKFWRPFSLRRRKFLLYFSYCFSFLIPFQ
ncbi:unnamed protein product [Larinioides sclopetarius]|uniref:Uncharacterized protein n=1 Tax=Larinioides sclopetarius TaxID=280406 RepID=A0AAV2AFZ0_9ARAC